MYIDSRQGCDCPQGHSIVISLRTCGCNAAAINNRCSRSITANTTKRCRTTYSTGKSCGASAVVKTECLGSIDGAGKVNGSVIIGNGDSASGQSNRTKEINLTSSDAGIVAYSTIERNTTQSSEIHRSVNRYPGTGKTKSLTGHG